MMEMMEQEQQEELAKQDPAEAGGRSVKQNMTDSNNILTVPIISTPK